MVVAAPYPAARRAAAVPGGGGRLHTRRPHRAVAVPVAVAAPYPAARQAAAVPVAAVAVFLASAARAFPRCAIRERIAAGLQGRLRNQLSWVRAPSNAQSH